MSAISQTKTVTPQDIQAGRIDADNTSVIRKAKEIETNYRQALEDATSLIISRINVLENIDISIIKQDFSNYITEINRASIELLYQVGAIYVNDSNASIYFTTDTDLQNIKEIAREATSLYFLKVFQFLKREQEIDFANFTRLMLQDTMNIDTKKTRKKSFLVENNIQNLVTTISTRAVNAAIVSKSRQLLNLNLNPNLVIKSAALSTFEAAKLKKNKKKIQTTNQTLFNSTLLASLENEEMQQQREQELDLLLDTFTSNVGAATGIGLALDRLLNRDRDEQQGKLSQFVIFTTSRDDRVCVICQSLEGQIFEVNDPDIIIPPDQTHINCRCVLLNIDNNDNVMI